MVHGNIFESVDKDRQLVRTVTEERASRTERALSPIPPEPGDTAQILVPLLAAVPETPFQESGLAKRVTWVVRISLVVNVALLLVKLFVFVSTASKAVLASLSDSVVDILCQCIIFWADHARSRKHAKYPIGRARLETLGVVLCSVTMSLASAAVIEFAATELWQGFVQGTVDELHFDLTMSLLLGLTIASKAVLLAICAALAKLSDVARTLALDHLNDVLSNIVALAAALIASWQPQRFWWADAVGAVLVSLYIIYSWLGLANEQIARLVGMGAPDEFVQVIFDMGNGFHPSMQVDSIRAYHFGAHYLVEVEVVLPPQMTVRESHDIALALQHKIEAIEDVERAFVHVDWCGRSEPEHKVDRQLHAQNDLSHAGSLGVLHSTNSL